MLIRLRHLWLGLLALLLLVMPRHRHLWREMRANVRALPHALEGPLPDALRAQTPAQVDLAISPAVVRTLADAAALFERRSPLGLCLRRSLLRYRYLRRAGLALSLSFGARFQAGTPDRTVTGHAWTTLDGHPYFEAGRDYQGFTVVLRYPGN
jgi:hypothetical protein